MTNATLETGKSKTRKRGRYGAGCVYRPAGCQFWYVQYRCDGRQIRESSRSTVKAEATALLTKRLGECGEGKLPFQTQKKVTYGQLRSGLLKYYQEQGRKSFQTLANGEQTIWGLSKLDEFFGYKPATPTTPEQPGVSFAQITTISARRFAEQRETEGISNATINRSLASLRKMLNLAKEEKLISDVPVIRMRQEPPARQGFLPREKFDGLIAALPSNLRPLVSFLYFTGVRLGEARQIEWRQVNLDAGFIFLEAAQTKNGNPRVAPLTSDLKRMLAAMKDRDGLVFDTTNLTRAWRKACVTTGLGKLIEVPGKPYDPHYEGLILHDLRRSAIRNLMDADVSESVAMKISGHKTNAVFKRYHIINVDDTLAAMRAVEARQKAAKALPKASLALSPAKKD